MSRYHGNSCQCPNCGTTYGKFRTGMTYRDAYQMAWCRPHKRRHTVLGIWHQVKRELWEEHLGRCEDNKSAA